MMHGALKISDRAIQKIKQPLVPASFSLGQAWFLVCCFGKQEDNVEYEIKLLGFPTFNPKMSRTKIHRGRRQIVHTSLFPGYLFVAFDRERDEWAQIKAKDPRDGDGIEGLIGVLKNNDIPIRIPDIEVERLQNAENAGLFDLTSASANFKVDELVEIMKPGPLLGYILRVHSATAKKRVKLADKFLGIFSIESEWLRKVAA